MKRPKLIFVLPILSCMTLSCIDNDYDLSKDIDLTINAGGNLTLPMSSTQQITLSQILDLSESSTIKEVSTDGEYGLKHGDYVLSQSGDKTTTFFNINDVEFKNGYGNTDVSDVMEFIHVPGLDEVRVPLSEANINLIDIHDEDVTKELVKLIKADLDVVITFSIGYLSSDFTGQVILNDDIISSFDDAYTFELVNSRDAEYAKIENGHILKFTKKVPITAGKPLNIQLRLKSIDFTQFPDVLKDGKFNLQNSVTTNGSLSITSGNLPVGGRATLQLQTVTDLDRVRIKSVTAVINPTINIDPTTFEISDIPDFLRNDNNYLDIDNPQFTVIASNTSNAKIELNATLNAISGKGNSTIAIGRANGTAPIIIGANKTTKICISRHPIAASDCENIVVDNLHRLITTIPDRVEVASIDAKVVQEPLLFQLDHDYNITSDYEVSVPLAFGKDLQIVYDIEENGWNEDIKDYDFKEVQVSLTATNSIPLGMTPEIIPVDINGNPLNNITVEIEGSVAAGNQSNQTTSELKAIIKSTETLRDLDGVKINFVAKSSEKFIGTNLNSGQSLKLHNIKLSIIGGVTVDLDKI